MLVLVVVTKLGMCSEKNQDLLTKSGGWHDNAGDLREGGLAVRADVADMNGATVVNSKPMFFHALVGVCAKMTLITPESIVVVDFLVMLVNLISIPNESALITKRKPSQENLKFLIL